MRRATHAGDGQDDRPVGQGLVLEDAAGKRAVLVTLDLVGIERHYSQSICEKLQSKYQLDRSQIALNCSHTHSGPVVARNLRPMHFYGLAKEQQDQVLAVCRRWRTRSSSSSARQSTASRRPSSSGAAARPTSPSIAATTKSPKCPMLREAGQLLGPVDHDVPVLAVKDESGKLRAVAVRLCLPCHGARRASTGRATIPASPRSSWRKAIPAASPCSGPAAAADQNPLPRRTEELAEKYGKKLAAAVNEVLAKPLTPIAGSSANDLCRDSTRPRQAADARRTGRANQRHEQVHRHAGQDAAGRDRRRQAALADVSVSRSAWQLGNDVQWFFLGGEVVVDFAIRAESGTSAARRPGSPATPTT